MRPHLLSLSAASLLLCAVTPALASTYFTDVPSAYPYAASIDSLYTQGIISGDTLENGTPTGTFRPNDTINRAEFTKIVVGAIQSGGSCASGGAIFNDVDTSTSWYGPYICVAKHDSLVSGYADGSFRPRKPISFAEASKILALRFGKGADAVFGPDKDAVWYKPFVEFLGHHGAIPTSIHSFGQLITRGEMAEMVFRLGQTSSSRPSQTYDTLVAPSSPLSDDTYTNARFGFSLKFPSRWTDRRAEEGRDYYENPVVSFELPRNGSGYDYVFAITIYTPANWAEAQKRSQESTGIDELNGVYVITQDQEHVYTYELGQEDGGFDGFPEFREGVEERGPYYDVNNIIIPSFRFTASRS